MDNQEIQQNINQPSATLGPSQPAKKKLVKFGLSIAIIIIAIVAAAIAVYWINTELVEQPSLLTYSKPVNNTTAGWQTYRDEIYGFEFKYPSGLIVRDDDTLKNDGSDRYNLLVEYSIFPTAASAFLEMTTPHDNEPLDPLEWEVINGFTFPKDWGKVDCLCATRPGLKNGYMLGTPNFRHSVLMV